MTPHLSAKLLKPASPRLHLDIPAETDDDMVYSPYYHPQRSSTCTTKPRRRSTQLSAEVRADIVARVLDPAYSGRHRDDYSSRVLIDPNGDEHDPDYQLFPTIYPTRHRQTTSGSGFFRRMPSEDDLTQDDDDAESIIAWTRERAASPITPSGSSACTPSPPPNPLSLFGDDEWDEKEWTKEVVVPVPAHKRRKSKAVVYVPNSPPIQPMPSFDESEPEFSPARHSSVKLVREDTMDTDETPSCGYVLRRQWATFALHTRLSAHRIARRARRVVSVGT